MSINAAKARHNLGSAAKVRNSIRSRQIISSGDIALDAVNVDPSVASPFATVEVTVDLRETAEFVGPFDPALCAPILGTGTGLTANVTVTPDWASGTQESVCIPVSSLGSNTRSLTFSFVAPSVPSGTQETHSITVEIQQPGLDPESTSKTITVEKEGFDEPQDGDSGSGGNGGDDGGLLGFLNDLPTILGLLLLLVAITTIR